MQSQSKGAASQASHTILSQPARRGGRPPKQHDTLAGIPVSAYAPVGLPHPLELYGPRFLVHISTPLTFHPDTLSRAVLGTGMDGAIRKLAPRAHQFMRKMAYLAAGKHRLSAGMRGLIEKELVPPFPGALKADLLRGLDGEEVESQPSSHWSLLLQGLRRHDPGALELICQCLSACDAHGLYMRQLARRGQVQAAEDHLRTLLEPDIRAWLHLNAQLQSELYVLVEVALKALAWLECQLEPPAGAHDPQRSSLAELLSAGHRPIGNWLVEVCQHSRRANLADLANHLWFKSRYLARPLKHDLLRKWASSTELLMPRAALPAVLAGTPVLAERKRLEARFDVARFFTFVCAVLRAGTHGTPQPWEMVQEQVRSRYEQAYRLQVLHAPAIPGGVADAR